MSNQPEVLKLADEIVLKYKHLAAKRKDGSTMIVVDPMIADCATELRRLHAANKDSVNHFDALMKDYKKSQEINAELLEALKLGLSACQSVSLNRSRKIDDGDGQFNYWQTGEWCEWLDGEVTQTLRAAIAKATGEQA